MIKNEPYTKEPILWLANPPLAREQPIPKLGEPTDSQPRVRAKLDGA